MTDQLKDLEEIRQSLEALKAASNDVINQLSEEILRAVQEIMKLQDCLTAEQLNSDKLRERIEVLEKEVVFLNEQWLRGAP